MCQRLNTGESNNFYFGIFICIGPLRMCGKPETVRFQSYINGGKFCSWQRVSCYERKKILGMVMNRVY